MLVLHSSMLSLTLPTLHTNRPHVPLDTVSLALSRSAYESLGGRRWLGLLCTPPEGILVASNLCGVVCEVSECGGVDDGAAVLLRAVAFGRYRIVGVGGPQDGDGALAVGVAQAVEAAQGVDGAQQMTAQALVPYEVEPWRDDAPEDDQWLRSMHGLEARNVALTARERRCHLLYRQVEQLLAWSGSGVAVSARAAQLSDADAEETNRAIHRFAPCAAERAAAAADGCAADDECTLAPEPHACLLERAYLHASAPEAPVPGAPPDPAAAFSVGRAELYSFALSRLFDLSPAEALGLLEGRSTAARLSGLEPKLGRTATWLESRLGLHEELGAADAHAGAPTDDENSGLLGMVGPLVRRLGRSSGGEDGFYA